MFGVLNGRPFAFREGVGIWPSTFFLFILSAIAAGARHMAVVVAAQGTAITHAYALIKRLAAFLVYPQQRQRIVTNPQVFERPERMGAAWQQVAAWLTADVAWIPAPTPRHASVLGSLLGTRGVQAGLVPDAHLAALAIEHGLVLQSTDGDFARFPGLRWHDPMSVTGGPR